MHAVVSRALRPDDYVGWDYVTRQGECAVFARPTVARRNRPQSEHDCAVLILADEDGSVKVHLRTGKLEQLGIGVSSLRTQIENVSFDDVDSELEPAEFSRSAAELVFNAVVACLE